jgi:hypothetical protein
MSSSQQRKNILDMFKCVNVNILRKTLHRIASETAKAAIILKASLCILKICNEL